MCYVKFKAYAETEFAGQMTMNTLPTLLLQTLNPTTQKEAEKQLLVLEQRDPSFAISLLQLVAESNDPSIRLSGAIYLKNLVKKSWSPEEDQQSIQIPSLSTQDQRSLLKRHLLDISTSLPANLQLHLSEIISTISSYDFPDNWQELLPSLVSKLSANDYQINNGVLQIAHAIFKKYRHAFRSDPLFAEINYVLQHFAEPLLNLYKTTDSYIDSNCNNKNALLILHQSLFLMNKIFYSLSSQDIPAYFEDHVQEFMNIFKKYLTYTNSLLITDEDDSEPGPLEKTQASICEIIHLYTQRYDEECPMLPNFIETVLILLSRTPVTPKYEHLAGSALSILTVAAKQLHYKKYFEYGNNLKILCEQIILPNLQMLQSDEEFFESEPLDYIRRDLEGSDVIDSRRKSSQDLIRSLLQLYSNTVLPIFQEYIAIGLKDGKRVDWKRKCLVLHIYLAITAQTVTVAKGVTSLYANMDPISIQQFIAQYTLPDLKLPQSTVHPLLIYEEIKLCMLLRSYISKETLLELLSYMGSFLNSTLNMAVYTMAAILMEKILGSFTSKELVGTCEMLSAKLLPLLSSKDNEFVMRAILRLTATMKYDLAPFGLIYFQELTGVLQLVCKNPSNPRFHHYLFECMACLFKFTYSQKNAQDQEAIERIIVPVFQKILQEDITEFAGYVFILLSAMIEHSAVRIPYLLSFFFEPLLQEGLWMNKGNVPAVARLLEAFIYKKPEILDGRYMNAVMGIVQKLLNNRQLDHIGFELAQVIVDRVPNLCKDAELVRGLLITTLQRAQAVKTVKFARCFFVFLCHFICFAQINNESILVHALESIQAGLFGMIAEAYLLLDNIAPLDENERKLFTLSYSILLGNQFILDRYDYLWVRLLERVTNVQSTMASSAPIDVDILETSDAESSFTRLRSVNTSFSVLAISLLPDGQAALVQVITRLISTSPKVSTQVDEKYINNLLGIGVDENNYSCVKGISQVDIFKD